MSIEELKNIIENNDNIVFFGGAGVSTESNIPDFRSSTGLYRTKNSFEYPPETILSHSFFIEHTNDFYDFYKNKMLYKNAMPNKAHFALSELEKQKRLTAVITQNIDGLHQLAGSKNVLELHGSVHRNFCTNCRKNFSLDYIINSSQIPKCDVCGNIIKPDVVLYEEALDINILKTSISYIENAKILIIGGTSLNVYPAASLVQYFNGSTLILINKSSTNLDYKANIVINEDISKTLSFILK